MFSQSAKAAHRLFFALRPPIVLARQIANAAPWFRTAGAPLTADRLHITMFILDDRRDLPAPLIAALREAGDGIAAPPVETVLDRVVGSSRSVALRPGHANPALAALHRQLADRCRAADVAERASYAFNPHMTLGYRDGRPFTAAIAPVAWSARELVLIDSHLGRTRHDVLGRWALDAAEPQLDLFASAA